MLRRDSRGYQARDGVRSPLYANRGRSIFQPGRKKCGMPQKTADPKAGGDARGRAREAPAQRSSEFPRRQRCDQGHNLDQRQRSRDPFRDQLVGVALILDPAGMVMNKHARGGSLLERVLVHRGIFWSRRGPSSNTRLRYIGSRTIGFVIQHLGQTKSGSLSDVPGCTRTNGWISTRF